MHVNSLRSKITIHLARKAQMALLLAKKVIVSVKYLDFANIFLEKLANVLLEQIRVNKHVIKLEKSKQPSHGPFYSLELIWFKTLKNYIEINLANSFIRLLNLSANAPILFVHKLNDSLCLCVDY